MPGIGFTRYVYICKVIVISGSQSPGLVFALISNFDGYVYLLGAFISSVAVVVAVAVAVPNMLHQFVTKYKCTSSVLHI